MLITLCSYATLFSCFFFLFFVFCFLFLCIQILNVYEVWHWSKWQTGLFKNYVDRFYKKKEESSGWPATCTTEQEKQVYIDAVYQREGVRLDPDKMIFNAGVRAIAKLMLNS